MLTSASFQNFKALKALDVELSPFTVIVGKNGSGKTSVLQGIHYATQAGVPRSGEENDPNARLGLVFSGSRDPRRLVTLPGRGPMRIAMTDEKGLTLSLEARLPDDDQSEPSRRFVVTLTGHDPPSLSLPDDGIRAARTFLDSPGVRRFASAVFLHLDASVMVRPSASESEEPRLEHDGEGLASVLSYLAGAARETLDAVVEDLRRVVPQIQGIRTFPASVTRRRQERIVIGDQAINRPVEERVPGHRFSLDMGAGRIVPADLLSEGTVLALGLLVALRQPRCPRLVLLDDLDRALHAAARAELVRCVRSILASRPDVQVVCTSHSPDLLDQVQLDEVRVMALDADQHARCRRLSDHPESERWRNMLRTGEFWASVGEDWLLEAPGDGR